MKISKFRKYICCNIISLLGYFCAVIMAIFILIYTISASQLHMRADMDEVYAQYIANHIIRPYFSFYQTQIGLVIMLLIGTYFENKYYIKQGVYGLRLFEDNEKVYSRLFFTGLILNLCPIYVVVMFFISKIFTYMQNIG